MFSLLITIISIALVAALALATLFYGGEALNKGGDQAQATKLLNQSQQILGASDLFKADHSRWPYDLQELVNTGYLRTIPVSQLEGGALRNANAAEEILGQWKTPLPGRPVYVTEDVSAGVCSKVNLMTMKVDAVYAGLVPEVNSQCFASGGEYKAVASREWPAIPEAFPLATVASGMPAPTDAGWVVVEGRVLSPTGGGAETGGAGAAGAPVLTVSTLQHDFGARPLGTVNPAQLTVRNTGTAAMTFNNAPVVSGGPAFALSSTNCGPSLPAGDECTVELSFTPSALAQTSGSLAIDTNATASPTVVPLSGSGLGSVTMLSSETLDFETQDVGSSTSLQLTVRNEGNAPFDFSQAPQVSGNAAYSLVSTTCGASLSAAAQCALTVSFAPTGAGSATGSLTFSVNGAPYVVSLTGSGMATLSVALAGASLPDAMLRKSYLFDFSSLLTAENDAEPDPTQRSWSASALPAGLSLASDTGILSGTPTTVTAGESFTVTASYKNKQGQQVYVLKVGAYVFEVTQIATASDHTCALTPAGAVKCWGSNANGQLGNNSTVSSAVPVSVSGLGSSVVGIDASNSHTCALTSAGAVKCWGYNSAGQLGNNSTTRSLVPVDVYGLGGGVASISAGSIHTCAVMTSGGAKCWGYNNHGQLGDNSTTDRWVPVDVSGLNSGVASISAGVLHTCAVTTTGAAKCWGRNAEGQIGDNSMTQRLAPANVSGLGVGIASISAGYYHTCAVTTGGAAKCWGSDTWGQLGDDALSSGKLAPVDVSGLSGGVASVSSRNSHSCAVTSSGAAKCWGYNVSGQLGDNTTTNRFVPVPVYGLNEGVASISGNQGHTCAVMTNGAAKCWGRNDAGKLGNNSFANSSVPVSVTD